MRIALGGFHARTALLDRTDSLAFHQASHTSFRRAKSLFFERLDQAWAAIGEAAFFKALVQGRAQNRVFLASRPLVFVTMRVKAAGRYLQRHADFTHFKG